jgi:hypothetical protein
MISDWRADSGSCQLELGQLTINILSDDALLYVFDFYVAQASSLRPQA